MLSKSNFMETNKNAIPGIIGKYNADLNRLKDELNEELTRLLQFWSTTALDPENGGAIGRVDHDGHRYPKASKGSVLHSRLLWTFSAAYRTTGIDGYRKIADDLFEYMLQHFWDKEYGGLIWEIDFRGIPVNKRKQAYAQGFGIYAFSEYYRATENTNGLQFAVTLFDILEFHFKDPDHGGYLEALQYNWDTIEDMRLSEKDLNAPKSMNTHLHILEPYTNLYRVWKDTNLRQSIADLIIIFQQKIINKEFGHFNLFFKKNWTVCSKCISFGHDIEGAWLLHEAAQVLQDDSRLKSVSSSALTLVNNTLKKGLDNDGALFNELENGRYDKDKHWWPQAEAMVGFIDAFEMQPEPYYLNAVFNIWEFIKNHLIDRKNGEWYWRVDEHGNPDPNDDKLGFWKCPYHNSRALMQLIERINKLTN